MLELQAIGMGKAKRFFENAFSEGSLSPVSSSRLREGNLYSPGTTTGSGAGSPLAGRANKRKKAHSSAIHPAYLVKEESLARKPS
ncbi:hypothetical protein TIFTF001_048198 [Ficus carica]|uniref:Uncharacterized protein n=1 Tax=Ficus carica TaxID=3494 RepID=A0AA88CS71_FICCA|nr:hypothetical protein TIFTF001_048198 [Ficus carica]